MFPRVALAGGGRVLAAGASAAVVTAGQSTANARVSSVQGPRGVGGQRVDETLVKPIQDDWLVTDLVQGKLSFTESEIDEGAEEFRARFGYLQPAGYLIEGQRGTVAIEGASGAAYQVEEPQDEWARRADSNDTMMQLASVFLKKPGMQQEILRQMAEDEEVRLLMERLFQRGQLDQYLADAGFNEPLLLGPAESSDFGQPFSAPPQADFLQMLVATVSGACARAGEAIGSLGRWLQGFAARRQGPSADKAEGEANAPGARPRANLWQAMGPVVVIMVSLVCFMLAKRAMRRAR